MPYQAPLKDMLFVVNELVLVPVTFVLRRKAATTTRSDAATAFVVVASPRRDAVAEALFFARKLKEALLAGRR